MLISHKDHNNTIQVNSMSVMTHVKALEAGQSSQGTSGPITPELEPDPLVAHTSLHDPILAAEKLKYVAMTQYLLLKRWQCF